MTIEKWLSNLNYDDCGGTQIWSVDEDGGSQLVAEVRGWGALQNEFPTTKEAEKFQDDVGKFIVEAIKEKLERISKKKIKFTEQEWSSLNNNTPFVVSRRVKGKIVKVGEEWWVSHNLFDPYCQVPMQLPIHSVVITSELTLDENVYCDIIFENNKYFALLVNN